MVPTSKSTLATTCMAYRLKNIRWLSGMLGEFPLFTSTYKTLVMLKSRRIKSQSQVKKSTKLNHGEQQRANSGQERCSASNTFSPPPPPMPQ